jgi:sulfide dehydrogenase cytochrome subunit
MRIKFFVLTAMAAALVVGCSTAEKAVDKAKSAASAVAKAAPKAKPKLLSGASAEMLANTCAGCHGTNGASGGPATPTIAGLEEEYFVDVMNDFKDGNRYSTIMGRIAKGYTDEEIAAMAGFFSKKPFKPALNQTARSETGAKLHDEYCEKCHEDGATDLEGIVLAGQWVPYINWTMWDFANGVSKISDKKMKKKFDAMVAEHGKKSITELVAFYGSRSK